MLYKIVLIYLLIMTLATFVLCGMDKFAAQKQMRRVPEKTFFLLSALGGSVGMFAGMLTFRHKTQHWYFKLGIPAIIIAQAALAILIMRLFA